MAGSISDGENITKGVNAMDATYFTMVCGIGGVIGVMLAILFGFFDKDKAKLWAISGGGAIVLLFVFILTPFFVEYNTKKIDHIGEGVVVGFNDAGRITAVNDGPMFCWNRCTNAFRLVEAENRAVIWDGKIYRRIPYRAQMRVIDLQKFFDHSRPWPDAVKNNDYGAKYDNLRALDERAQWSLDQFGYATRLELAAFNDPLNKAHRTGLENLLKSYLNSPERLGRYGMEVTRLLDFAITVEP